MRSDELDGIRGYALALIHKWGIRGDDAEDIAQEAVIRVWCRQSTFLSRGKLTSWVHTIVLNEVRQFWRRSRPVDRRAPDLLRTTDSPAVQLLRQERRRSLLELLEALPPRRREIMEMLYSQDRTVRDVAEELRIAESTVRAHRSRSLSMLRARAG